MNSVISRKEVPGTPFTIIKDEKEGWFLTMGDYRLSAPASSEQAIRAYIKLPHNWELMGRMMIAYIDFHERHPERTKNH